MDTAVDGSVSARIKSLQPSASIGSGNRRRFRDGHLATFVLTGSSSPRRCNDFSKIGRSMGMSRRMRIKKHVERQRHTATKCDRIPCTS